MTTPLENDYALWREALEELARAPGTVVLLGDTDTGKTTFTRLLIRYWTEAGYRVGVLDADIGQSEIGPPTCIGLAYTQTPVLALSDLSPHALAFVGSASPRGHTLEYVCALHRLYRQAVREQPGSPLIVDTPGYIHGRGALRLHQACLELLGPCTIVALQRNSELEPVLAPFRHYTGYHIFAPPIPDVLSRKPPAYRAQRRVMRFAAYLQNARMHTYSFDAVACCGLWLGSGTPLAAHQLAFVRQVLAPQIRVYYAELCGQQLGLMVGSPVSPQLPALSIVQKELHAQSFCITTAPQLHHLLIGLESSSGKLLGIGCLEALDFRRRTLGIVTPVRAPAAACILRFGSLRVRPDGTEVGTARLSEF
ncbi:MAG: Clp1/GlmU family protein [Chloroherpetonaceae bacterium]|nr:Clp1/GlmU family protein [Chthonomonadaceae bacterium]MDW8206592.1 Clp1/GlmU family protein [Chloroherpetonaceae bacterium]